MKKSCRMAEEPDGASGILPDVDPPMCLATSSLPVAPPSSRFPNAWPNAYEGEGWRQITIDSIGSGAGFERFCEPVKLISPMPPVPSKTAKLNPAPPSAANPIEFRVGTDAFAVTVSAENDFVTDVTMEELAAIFSTAETWADVRAEWPAEAILRYHPRHRLRYLRLLRRRGLRRRPRTHSVRQQHPAF